MIPLKDNIPTDRLPIVTLVLIALNVVVFIIQMATSGDSGSAPSQELASLGYSARDQLTIEWGAIPRELTDPGTYCTPTGPDRAICGSSDEVQRATGVSQAPWWATPFSSMFMHADVLHIAFNMLFLWIFGNNVEDSMGRPRFVAFYLIGGVVAAYAQSLFNLHGFASTVPQIGASGAIAAVLGAYLVLFPRARVLTFVFLIFIITFIEIPAVILLVVWLGLQFLPAIGEQAVDAGGAGIAYWAHIGGFVVGALLIKLFATKHKRVPVASRRRMY